MTTDVYAAIAAKGGTIDVDLVAQAQGIKPSVARSLLAEIAHHGTHEVQNVAGDFCLTGVAAPPKGVPSKQPSQHRDAPRAH